MDTPVQTAAHIYYISDCCGAFAKRFAAESVRLNCSHSVQAAAARLSGSVKGLYSMRAGPRPLPYLGTVPTGEHVIPPAPFAANVLDASDTWVVRPSIDAAHTQCFGVVLYQHVN